MKDKLLKTKEIIEYVGFPLLDNLRAWIRNAQIGFKNILLAFKLL